MNKVVILLSSYNGEEYIENDSGDMRHYECFYGMKDLLEWLGYKVRCWDENCD